MTDRTLKGKVAKLQELQAEIDAMTAEADTIKDAIKAEMQVRSVDTIQTDAFTIRYTAYTSSRLDTAALNRELPDIAARYLKTTEARRFQIA